MQYLCMNIPGHKIATRYIICTRRQKKCFGIYFDCRLLSSLTASITAHSSHCTISRFSIDIFDKMGDRSTDTSPENA
jgi:hypothetical protein